MPVSSMLLKGGRLIVPANGRAEAVDSDVHGLASEGVSVMIC